jgi:two-component system, LytTR family, sensor kinase
MAILDRARLRGFALKFLAWTAAGLFFFTQDFTRSLVLRDPTPWWHFMVSWLTGMYLFGALTPIILWLGRRFPIERGSWLGPTVLHLLCSMVFSLFHLIVDSVLIARLGIFPQLMKGDASTTFGVLLVLGGFHGNIVTYWMVLGLQYTFRYYRQYQERKQHALRLELDAAALKTQLVQAHLGALKMQLQPHFLFNTLNAIMVLVRQQKTRQAEEMLARLSDLLRCVLEDVEAQEVPLRRELEYLRLYLSIEEVRFQDRLRVEIAADPAVLDAAVPHMGLQPLVENAVRHGIGSRSAAGRIEISAARVNENLEIRIRDDGPGLAPASASPSWGIGLANTRSRLQQLYDDRASLTIENAAQGGALVTMILPYHEAPDVLEPMPELMEAHAFQNPDRR